MSLEERLLKDMKEALRKQDKGRLSAIRMVRAAAKNKEIELRKKLSDEDIISVLVSVAKKHKDSIEKFKAGGRDDLVKKEEEELTVVQSYLPKPLKEKELAELIEAVIVEVGAEGKANPGRVMSVIIPRVKGRADGALVNKMVRERLEAKSEAG
ncbi:GatB/YqeY domain-containing protein [bacterium]|nr:GatB/YqeY domain-containing protein [bacterium]